MLYMHPHSHAHILVLHASKIEEQQFTIDAQSDFFGYMFTHTEKTNADGKKEAEQAENNKKVKPVKPSKGGNKTLTGIDKQKIN